MKRKHTVERRHTAMSLVSAELGALVGLPFCFFDCFVVCFIPVILQHQLVEFERQGCVHYVHQSCVLPAGLHLIVFFFLVPTFSVWPVHRNRRYSRSILRPASPESKTRCLIVCFVKLQKSHLKRKEPWRVAYQNHAHRRTEQSTSRRTLTLLAHLLEANRSRLETWSRSYRSSDLHKIWVSHHTPSAGANPCCPNRGTLPEQRNDKHGPWIRAQTGGCQAKAAKVLPDRRSEASPPSPPPCQCQCSQFHDVSRSKTSFGRATLGLDSLTDPC